MPASAALDAPPASIADESSAPFLPAPPDDTELYAYFGPQRRWVLLCISLSYAVTAATLFLFSLRHPALWVFLILLALNAAGLLLSCVDGQRQRRITRDSHELLLRAWHPAPAPSMDVFLPTCGEPIAVLRNAYDHVARLRWGGALRVWVLDDAARPEVRSLADAYGFTYRTRPDRGHLKKAGNLNDALARSDGDLIAILDADFCPRPDFLQHLAPYLETPDVGIVQSPQCFDTDARMPWLQRAAGSAQELFFRWLQPSRDADDAAICCGSNAVYRRSAVERIGGFARLDHSEDLYTGLAMLRAGYRTRYVPVLAAKGLSPATMPAFVNQQYRWAMGNLHLLTDTEFRRMPGPWRWRLAYVNGVLGYLMAAVNVFAAPLPPLVMMFCYPAEIRPWHALPLLAPLWVWLVLLPSVSATRWRMEVIRAHLMVSFAGALALVHTLRHRSAAWVPTGTGGGRSALARTVGRVALGWLAVTTIAMWAGVAYDAARYGWAQHWGVAGYAALMTYLNVPLIAALFPDESR
ncbi:glycosyltransferase family 2 protein [Krasilnikovia sp. MM14-A1259]|uniref:glycosyltransferase family 2 protein n=1 Tax=Krasilnikovia sp. MM14-A1259 TaxID=3373539 RepID=UPI0038222C8A